MALENLTGPDVFITSLVQANPTVTDPVSQGDDHLRGIKNVLLNSFPNIDAPLTVSSADINGFAPLASPAFTGVPTAPTAAAGTDTTQLATTAFVKANQSGLGIGQTWQDVKASRVIGTTYTNDTGSPIFVSVAVSSANGGASSISMQFFVNGGQIFGSTNYSSNPGFFSTAGGIVPAGATYSANASSAPGSYTYQFWKELR